MYYEKVCLFINNTICIQKIEWDVTTELENLVVFRAILRKEYGPRVITCERYHGNKFRL